MSWVRLDDHFPTHPKVVAAGGDAAWLHVCALCYCAEHLTDGLVPKRLLARLSDRKQPTRLAQRLVDAGMWSDDGDDYRIHDYLTYNRSRVDVEAEREAARLRRQNGGKRSADVRANKPRRSDGVRENDMNPDPTRPDSPTESAGAPKSKPKRAQRLPDDWAPTEATKEWARREFPAHATRGVLEAFKDHARAKGTVFVNWDLAFKNWVRNEAKFHPAPETKGPGRTFL